MFTVNEKINKLTILKLKSLDSRNRKHYLCRCDCGLEKTIQGSLIKSGNTKSCGCLASESKKKKLLPENKGVINQIILGYKRHAKDRNIEWELSYENVSEIIKKPCHYCGTPPSNNKITKNCNGFKYSGIDRVDSNLKYAPDNVVSCCNQCNKSKMALSKGDFLNWIERVYKYQNAMAAQWG